MPASVLWLLSEDLTIQQASLLFLNLDPSEYDDVEKQLAHNQPSGYGAIRQALKSALRKGKLKGNIKPEEDIGYSNERVELADTIDVKTSTIEVDSLKAWLASKNLEANHLFELTPKTPDYLDPLHPHYSAKLAATIEAWKHVSASFDESKQPKAQLRAWLEANASTFGAANEDSEPSGTFLEEASKLANWREGGGRLKAGENKKGTDDEKTLLEIAARPKMTIHLSPKPTPPKKGP